MNQQVSQEELNKLKENVLLHYNNVNAHLEQFTIFSLPSKLLSVPPCLIFTCLFLLVSFLSLFIRGGPEWLLKIFGLVIPLFLTWNSLYNFQPLPPTLNQQQSLTTTTPTTDLNQSKQPAETTTSTTTTSTTPIEQQQIEVAQTNDPRYLFWAKYWLIYCMCILIDKVCQSLLSMTSNEEWISSYTWFFNLHMLLIILPPWFYPQTIYSYIIEPLLLVYFPSIRDTYQTTKETFGTIAQDTLSTTTTAFRSVGRHALVGGIQSLTSPISPSNIQPQPQQYQQVQ